MVVEKKIIISFLVLLFSFGASASHESFDFDISLTKEDNTVEKLRCRTDEIGERTFSLVGSSSSQSISTALKIAKFIMENCKYQRYQATERNIFSCRYMFSRVSLNLDSAQEQTLRAKFLVSIFGDLLTWNFRATCRLI